MNTQYQDQDNGRPFPSLGAPKESALQDMFAALIKKHELTTDGEAIYPDLTLHPHHNIIQFHDEFMMYIIAGHVAGNVYDEMERGLWSLGIQIDDTDGCDLYFSSCEPVPMPA